jgi:lipoyl(octanoyl) transferase
VWAGDGTKIAAIGVRVSRGVATHGFALNVCPDLSYFERIVPCGDPEGRATSMSALLGEEVAVERVVPVVECCFGAALSFDMRPATLEELA